jgi:putative membrane protein
VVKHSESIEETAAIFSRYVKMLVNDPRYARFALGLPGLLLIILAALYYFNLLSYFLIVAVFVVSGIMLVKGFGADRAAKNLYRWAKEYSPPPLRVQISSFAAVAGVLCIVLGIYLGWANAAIFLGTIVPPSDLGGWLSILPQLAGYFIMDAITLIIVGLCVAFMGRAIRWYLEHDARLLRNAALIVSIAWSRQILGAASSLLIRPELGYESLIYNVLVGILIGIASVLVIFVVHRSFRGFFVKTRDQVEEFGED